MARLVAGRDPLADSYLGASLEDDFAAVTGEAEILVGEFTGLRFASSARAEVLDRQAWVDANIESTRRLFGPLLERLGSRMAASPWAFAGRHVAGSELGALLGYVAQRVLGQYDQLVPEDSPGEAGRDAVYYVGPNVLALEKRFAFRPLDFRRWIALHEVTHRAQFCGVPWMRSYFASLVDEVMTVIDPDPRRFVRALARAAEELRRGRNPLDEGGLMGLLATPEQRTSLARVHALMSLLEGHGNYVMSELGRRHVVGEERMARVLRGRRQAGGLTGALHKIFGLESKMRQYEIGERFVRAVAAEAGPGGIAAAWLGPANLPTAGELEAPLTWLERVDGARRPA